MKTVRKGFFAIMGTGAVLACAVLLAGCAAGNGVDLDDLDGAWLVTGEDGEQSKAIIAEFSGSSFEIIFYTDTQQDGGARGSFSIDEEAGILTVSVTEEWDEGAMDWVSASDTVNIPFSVSGDELDMDLSAVTGETGPPPDLTLARTSFTRPQALVGTWNEVGGDGGVLVLEADGSFNYTAGEGDAQKVQSGNPWDASDEYLRSVVTYDEFEPWGDCSVASLSLYTLEDGGDTLELVDYGQTYSK